MTTKTGYIHATVRFLAHAIHEHPELAERIFDRPMSAEAVLQELRKRNPDDLVPCGHDDCTECR